MVNIAASLRQMCKCIGLSGKVSVIQHFFGYSFFGHSGSVSLLKQASLLKGRHIHLNLVRVALESFGNAEEQEIDAAVQTTRAIYATVNLGIGLVGRYYLLSADAKGHEVIEDDDETEDLTDDFYAADNNAIDVFFVPIFSGSAGNSPVDGPCDKHSKSQDGIVVGINNSNAQTARTLAHEIGHYLGLEHSFYFYYDFDTFENKLVYMYGPDNLMVQSRYARSITTSTLLTSSQGKNVREHCFVGEGC